MIKSIKRDCMSVSNENKQIEKYSTKIPRHHLLYTKKISQDSIRTLFLKFKTQKASPKRISNFAIKNNSKNKEVAKNQKNIIIINNKDKTKVLSKNDSRPAFIRNKINNNNHMIHFRNQLSQNNRYFPRSFENILSNKLENKNNEEAIVTTNIKYANIQKHRSNNIINIKRKYKKNEDKELKKKNKKIIRTQDIHFRNYNYNNIKEYAINFNTSNARINSYYNYDNMSLSKLNTIQRKEDYSYFPRKVNEQISHSNFYKKINDRISPVTVNISRKFSRKKNMSNDQSLTFNRNKNSLKEEYKFLILTNVNSNLQEKLQNEKSNNAIGNKNFKYNKNNYLKNKINYINNKLNNEIKVSKQNAKKKKIIIIGKNAFNSNNLYKYCNTNINNSIKNNELMSEFLINRIDKNKISSNNINNFSTENKKSSIYSRIIQNQKMQSNNIINIINNNFNIIKKVSKPNTKSKNSINNLKPKNQMVNNKKSIYNKFERQKNLKKFQVKKSLNKKLTNENNNSKLNSLKNNNAFMNKINKNKKLSNQNIINYFPKLQKFKKYRQYTLTCNSRTFTPIINIYNNSFSSIKKNKTKIEEFNMYNKLIVEPYIKGNQKDIKNNSKEIDFLQNELKINIEGNNTDKKYKNHIYYFEESERISNYIQNYFALNNDYPPSNISLYKFGRIIGKGAFGKVNLGLHILTGRIVAIKSFNKTKFIDQKYREKIFNEIELMSNLKHFSVVKLLDTFETEKYILIVMENVLGGDLLTFIKKRNKLPEDTAKFIFRQLLESLNYIHNKNIVHRDIKLDNILIDLNNNIKLCDFGVGKYIPDNSELLFEQCGTPAYIAPEVLEGNGYKGFPVDLWSSGIVLYSLLMGSIPFKAHNLNGLKKLIMSGDYKKISGISKNAIDLLNKLLEIDPKKRINVQEALNHPWFLDRNENRNILFTKAELILLSKNKVDYRNCSNEEIIENFTIENLDTNKFNENSKTKSFIFAPFNTSLDLDQTENEFSNDIELEKGLFVQNNIILFEQDANALNRQYELNNNGEIDHGVIIINSNDRKKIDDNDSNNYNNELINSKKSNKEFNNGDNFINKKENESVKKEKYTLNNIKVYNPKMTVNSTLNKPNNINTRIPNSNSIILDENIIIIMENFGYKKEYIQKCIINNDINYCFATYYLLLNSSKSFD